jgi:hypothetical protein
MIPCIEHPKESTELLLQIHCNKVGWLDTKHLKTKTFDELNEMQDLGKENILILLRNINEDLNKWKKHTLYLS